MMDDVLMASHIHQNECQSYQMLKCVFQKPNHGSYYTINVSQLHVG